MLTAGLGSASCCVGCGGASASLSTQLLHLCRPWTPPPPPPEFCQPAAAQQEAAKTQGRGDKEVSGHRRDAFLPSCALLYSTFGLSTVQAAHTGMRWAQDSSTRLLFTSRGSRPSGYFRAMPWATQALSHSGRHGGRRADHRMGNTITAEAPSSETSRDRPPQSARHAHGMGAVSTVPINSY